MTPLKKYKDLNFLLNKQSFSIDHPIHDDLCDEYIFLSYSDGLEQKKHKITTRTSRLKEYMSKKRTREELRDIMGSLAGRLIEDISFDD